MRVEKHDLYKPSERLFEPLELPQGRLLTGPGPSNCAPRVLRAAGQQVLGHLHPEFLEVMDTVKVNIKYAWHGVGRGIDDGWSCVGGARQQHWGYCTKNKKIKINSLCSANNFRTSLKTVVASKLQINNCYVHRSMTHWYTLRGRSQIIVTLGGGGVRWL